MRRLTYTGFRPYDHAESDADFDHDMVACRCICCGTKLAPFIQTVSETEKHELLLCSMCGWWHVYRLVKFSSASPPVDGWARWYQPHHAVLSEIRLTSEDVSIDALRQHLLRFWNQRKDITASQAEDLVASILKDFYGGDVVRVTANTFSPDGGVDLLVVEKGGLLQRAVQIKRRLTDAVESVGEIRNFIGAMLLAGQDRGTFVTTASRFSQPALDVRRNTYLAKHRLELELVDGERLLELLEHSNRQKKVDLPPQISRNVPWESIDRKIQADTDAVFFGDLSKLFDSRSQ